MERASELADVLRRLEEQLLQPEIRRSADQVSYLLADEFVEFGSSGRVFDKAQIIASLQQEKEQAAQRTIDDFSVKWLTPEIALLAYRLVVRRGASEEETHTLRSSIWKLIDGRWQMIFHQGTPAKQG